MDQEQKERHRLGYGPLVCRVARSTAGPNKGTSQIVATIVDLVCYVVACKTGDNHGQKKERYSST